MNVRTRRSEASELRLYTGLGNFGTDVEHGVASFGTSRVFEQLSLARDRTTGFMANRDYRNLSMSSLTSLKSKPGAGSLLLIYSDKPYGAEQFYGNYPSWERIKTWFASVHQDLGRKTEASFAFRRQY